MRLVALGVILQLAHPLLLRRLVVAAALVVMAVRLRPAVLVEGVQQVLRQGQVIHRPYHQAKEIMAVQHQVLQALAGVVLVPQGIILLRPGLRLAVQAVRVYLALLLAVLIIGLAVAVALYLRLELKVLVALAVLVVEAAAVLVTIQEVRLV